MKVLIRIKNSCSDKVLLKPLTLEEYQEKVYCYYKDVESRLNAFSNKERLDKYAKFKEI